MANNPFIDSLPTIHSYADFEKLIELRPDLSSVFSSLSHEDREEYLGDDIYVPSQFAWEVYQNIIRIMRKGYRKRNPLDNSFTKHNHEWTFKKSDLYSESFKEKRGFSGVISGPSGIGKTVLVDRLLQLIPKTRLHNFDSLIPNASFLQIVWIKIDCDADSRKDTLLNIARQIQSHVPHDIGVANLSRLNTPELRKGVVAICRQFAVGLIVIDECQTLTSLPFEKDGKTTSTEFLEKLYQDLGVPLLTIGTPEYRDLLKLRPQTHRRMTQNLSLEFKGYDENDDFWMKLVQVYICNVVFPKFKLPSKKKLEFIHAATCGNVSLLEKLCSSMLMLRNSRSEAQLTEDFLMAAYQAVKADLTISKSLVGLGDSEAEEEASGRPKEKTNGRNKDKVKSKHAVVDDAGEKYRQRILSLKGKK